jgi:hypothetical protein
MKPLLTLFVFSLCIAVNAQTFVITNAPSQTTVLPIAVATNQLLIINGLGGFYGGIGGSSLTVQKGGLQVSNVFDGSIAQTLVPYYFQGPGTVTFRISLAGSYLLSYRITPSTGPETALFQTNSAPISVPAGKRIRFLDFRTTGYIEDVSLAVTALDGTRAKFPVRTSSPMAPAVPFTVLDLEGPLSVQPDIPLAFPTTVSMTYYLTSDVALVPAGVQAPSGSILTIEKSADLQTWTPAAFLTNGTAPKAFYRIKVAQ